MTRLAVYSHKPCWRSPGSPSGYATDGGFPFQMNALSEIFDSTTVLVPIHIAANRTGEIPLHGHNLTISPLTAPAGKGIARKIGMCWWMLRNSWRLVLEAARADVIHSPIPGDIGTFGMILAILFRKQLLVRHCGNWEFQRTAAERFWRWFMERYAGGRNVMLATGGSSEPPSKRNPRIQWIYSTSLTEEELQNCQFDRHAPQTVSPRLINVCRQEKFKGTDLLIESMPLLIEKFPGISLDLIGDGDAVEELKSRTVELDLTGCVKFHGKLDHERVLELLKKADLFCYPTKSDGFPKAVLEALACGLPVITTAVSVLPQLIGNGCGVIVENPTPETLARAIGEILSNETTYLSMSRQAFKTARQYSLESWRNRIGQLLREAA